MSPLAESANTKKPERSRERDKKNPFEVLRVQYQGKSEFLFGILVGCSVFVHEEGEEEERLEEESPAHSDQFGCRNGESPTGNEGCVDDCKKQD